MASDEDVLSMSAQECDRVCDEFKQITCANSICAMAYCQRAGWNLSRALDAYFTSGGAGFPDDDDNVDNVNNENNEGDLPARDDVEDTLVVTPGSSTTGGLSELSAVAADRSSSISGRDEGKAGGLTGVVESNSTAVDDDTVAPPEGDNGCGEQDVNVYNNDDDGSDATSLGEDDVIGDARGSVASCSKTNVSPSKSATLVSKGLAKNIKVNSPAHKKRSLEAAGESSTNKRSLEAVGESSTKKRSLEAVGETSTKKRSLEVVGEASTKKRSSESVGESSTKKRSMAAVGEANTSSTTAPENKAKKQKIDNTIDPFTIKIISWNIDGLDQKSQTQRTEGAIDVLVEECADVVFLQEVVPETFSAIKSRLDSSYEIIPANNEGYFTAMLLHRKTVLPLKHLIKPFPSSQMGRTLTEAYVNIKGFDFQLLTSHMESTRAHAPERRKQLAQAFKKSASVPKGFNYLLGGDLNLNDADVAAVGVPEGVVDVWESTGARPEARYTWDTSRNTNVIIPGKSKPRCRFDRFFFKRSTKANVELKHFGLVGLQKLASCGRFCSDHWGIVAYFKVAGKILK